MAGIGGERLQLGAAIDLAQHLAPDLDQRTCAFGRRFNRRNSPEISVQNVKKSPWPGWSNDR